MMEQCGSGTCILSYKLFSDLVAGVSWAALRSAPFTTTHTIVCSIALAPTGYGQTGATPTPAERERQARRAAAPHGP